MQPLCFLPPLPRSIFALSLPVGIAHCLPSRSRLIRHVGYANSRGHITAIHQHPSAIHQQAQQQHASHRSTRRSHGLPTYSSTSQLAGWPLLPSSTSTAVTRAAAAASWTGAREEEEEKKKKGPVAARPFRAPPPPPPLLLLVRLHQDRTSFCLLVSFFFYLFACWGPPFV